MNAQSYDLTKLDPASFEHMINLLAMKVLGVGHTGFGPGSDGGRDGFFEGEAPYPSNTDRWTGRWYIQSKFHAPHLSNDPQKWLIDKIKAEINEFQKAGTRRIWPDNWIIATNIDPSGAPDTGAFDQAKKLVSEFHPQLANNFHIWGGRKILDLLSFHPSVAEYYSEFLTPGNVITAIYNQINDAHANIDAIFRHLVVTQFNEQQHTKLEQAGSRTDTRPGIHRLFTDIPIFCPDYNIRAMAAHSLAKTVAQNHKSYSEIPDAKIWKNWQRHPQRSRVWFVKGGPGQGKSTFTQYICQIQRAALILDEKGPHVNAIQRQTAEEVKQQALEVDFWPLAPRVPIYIELKDYAQWFGNQADENPRGVLPYFAAKIGKGIGLPVLAGTLKRAFSTSRWLLIFDGLDEVPGDVKDAVSSEVIVFIDDVLVGCQSDVAAVCTSRPQGYSGQLSALDATTIELTHLSPQQALKCALPVLQIERSDEDSKSYYEILSEAILSPSIQEIMTSPLQAHIMAVVVRDGGKPPERRWALFNNFYHVIKKREANRKLPDKNLSRLLLQGDRLLKDLHNRLGFELHFQAETRKGARTSLNRTELRKIVYETVSNLQDNDVDSTVNTLMEATTERLVLVSTPETGQEVRFDIRPLQEFFAAEYIYESVPADKLSQRLKIIAGDSHWSEVMHFLMSALIENGRQTELSVAIGILLDLNENGDTGGMRSLSRRLALGGIIYSRLLQEGVLEQDKKIRHSFRACIDALLSSVDAVDFLCRVDRDHSKHWLIDVLADSLEEKTEPENIGASSVLAFIMPDNHKRLPEARKYISQSSFPYFSCVCEIIASNISDDQEIYGGKGSEYVKSPRWIVDIIIDRLISQEWTNISPKGLRHCLKILRNNKETVWEYCYKFLSDKETASFVTELLCVSDEWDDAQRELITEDRIGNAVEVKYYKTTGSHNYENASDHQIHSLKTMGGFLKVIALVFEFAKERNLNKYNELKAHCQNISEFVRSFPDYLAHLIPVRDSGDLISPDLPEFHYYLESRTYGARGEFSFLDLSSMTNNDMDIIISEYTGLTMHALTSEHDRKILGPVFQEYISSEAGLNTFAEVLDKDPLFLFSYSFYWSIIFSLPFSIGERLRRLAVGHCPCTFPHEAFGAITSTFQLRLPEEAEILPFILLMSSQSAENKHYIVSGTNEKQGKRQSLAQIIAEFAPNANDLLRISYDEKYSVSARSAASAMYLAHPGSDKENQYIIMGNLSSFYQLSPGHWFLSAVADVLRDFVNADDQTCIDTFGTLIQMSKSDYNSRFLMDRRIAKWRELSRAPVLKHGNMEIWN